MEDKFNIDDSMLLNPKGSRINNIKKILTAVAILVVLFLIVLIIMKFINSGDVETDNDISLTIEDTVENTEPTLADDLKKIEIKPMEKPQVSTSIEPLSSSNNSIETKVETKAYETSSVKEEPKKVDETSTTKEEPKKAIEETKTEQTATTQANQNTQEQSTPKQEVIVVSSKKDEGAKKDTAPKKASEPAKKKDEPKQQREQSVKKGTLQTSAAPKGSYIQVLAVGSSKPDASYIKKLVDNGYNYRLYKVNVSGKEITKVLVGPYTDGDKLQRDISNIRATINKNAFKYTIN